MSLSDHFVMPLDAMSGMYFRTVLGDTRSPRLRNSSLARRCWPQVRCSRDAMDVKDDCASIEDGIGPSEQLRNSPGK